MTETSPRRLAKLKAIVERLEHNAHGVIYGSITVLALLLAKGHAPEGAIKTALILFGSIFAIVLAETFAKVSSDAVKDRRMGGWAELRAGYLHSRPTLLAANVPTLLIALAATELYTLDTGVFLAELAAIALLSVYGYAIGYVVYRRVLAGLFHGAVTGLIGTAVAVLKYAIH